MGFGQTVVLLYVVLQCLPKHQPRNAPESCIL